MRRATVAQTAEQRLRKPTVAGATPVGGPRAVFLAGSDPSEPQTPRAFTQTSLEVHEQDKPEPICDAYGGWSVRLIGFDVEGR